MKQIFALLLLSAYLGSCAFAGNIVEVTDDQVIFTTVGIPSAPGDIFVSLDEGNHIVGVYRIESMAKDLVKGKILKGTAKVGDVVYRYKTEVGTIPEKPVYNRWRDFQWGLALEGNYSEISLSVNRASSFDSRQYPVTLSGKAYGLTYFNQGPFYSLFNFRLLFGFQRYILKSTIDFPDCSETNKCSLDVIYGYFGPRLQIDIVEKKEWRLWVAAGGNAMIPLRKTSNIINTHDLQFNITYGGSVGADFVINNNHFITSEAEILFFPNSVTGKARSAALRIGYGTHF